MKVKTMVIQYAFNYFYRNIYRMIYGTQKVILIHSGKNEFQPLFFLVKGILFEFPE